MVTEQQQEAGIILLDLQNNRMVGSPTFGVGLLSIATFLKARGFGVMCMDMTDIVSFNEEQLAALFAQVSPALVGFTLSSDNLFEVQEYATRIKRWCPKTTVVVGGPLATARGGKVLDHAAFDVVVLGEGEFPMLGLARFKVRGEGALGDIPGLVYRSNGARVSTAPPVLIGDLDALPSPDYSLVPQGRFAWVVSARGCPYSCAFCFKSVHGTLYRPRDLGRVAREIIDLVEQHPWSIVIDLVDDNFVGNAHRVGELADHLEEYRRKAPRPFALIVQGRANVICKHPELLRHLKRAGAVNVLIGIESGSPEVLERYDKKLTVEQIKEAVRLVAEVGDLAVTGNFILGGPFENEVTAEKSLALGRELLEIAPGVVDLRRLFLAPFPGTRIEQDPARFGLRLLDTEFKRCVSMGQPAAVSEAFSATDLRRLGARFDQMMIEAMEANAHRIPRPMVFKTLEWALDYCLPLSWYDRVLGRRPVVAEYRALSRLPRSAFFEDIPRDRLEHWYAHRVMQTVHYSDDGSRVELPLSLGEKPLEGREEILVYELASGKLTIREMLDEYQAALGTDATRSEILERVFVPLFRRLEGTYHLYFHT